MFRSNTQRLFMIFVLCVLTSFVLSAPIIDLSGQELTSQEALESFPYMASVQRDDGSHLCGASLIAQNMIVTAAHCAEEAPDNALVKAKRFDLSKGTEEEGGLEFQVVKWIMHPVYDEDDYLLRNDIALGLVKLIDGSSASEIPIIPISKHQYFEDVNDSQKTAIAVGWGLRAPSNANIPDTLARTELEIVPLEECRQKMGSHISNLTICAGGEGNDVCLGDSGGPLIMDGVLIGVTSWGAGCGKAEMPSVFTRISAYSEWISGQIVAHSTFEPYQMKSHRKRPKKSLELSR